MSQGSSVDQLAEKTAGFQRRFLMVTAGITVFVIVIMLIIVAISEVEELASHFLTVLIALSAGISTALAYVRKLKVASNLFIFSILALLGLTTLKEVDVDLVGFSGYFLVIIMSAFLLHPRMSPIVGAISGVFIFVTALRVGGLSEETIILYIGSICVLALSFIIYLFSKEALGNLDFLRRRLKNNDDLFREVPNAASRLGAAAAEIFAMTEQQTQGTLRQASAIEETRQVLLSVAQASGDIVISARETLTNAETTLSNSERVAENVRTLSEHTKDIFQILELIKEVANKSDLLALNAALEGTKAGEAGRGFSLVASQMQRLAENITGSVKDIKELTKDINEATNTTQLSMEEATKLARATTSASEKINLITQQQRTSVEQVSDAMDDIASIATQVSAGTNQTVVSTEELKRLSEQLSEVVEKHRRAAE